jgi:hypothetical protein
LFSKTDEVLHFETPYRAYPYLLKHCTIQLRKDAHFIIEVDYKNQQLG